MKFLIIHNRYSRRGGEEGVVELQQRLLESHGHSVVLYTRRHGEVSRLKSFFTAIFNPGARREVAAIVAREKPDAAIIHNLFPIISTSILKPLRGMKVAMTLHNYRLICPNGLCYTRGRVCERCLRSNLFCVVNRCQGSLAGSVAWALRNAFAVPVLSRRVDGFFALSEFQRQKIAQKIAPEKIFVIPNAVDNLPAVTTRREDYVAFVGRLSAEKGIELLLEVARRLPAVQFKVAGERADNFAIEQLPDNIEILGFLNRDELARFYAAAAKVVVTSSCWEGFPLVPLEATYYRTPVVAPAWAAFTEILPSVNLYTPGDVDDLARKLTESNILTEDESLKILEKFSPQQYYRNIMRFFA